MTSSAAPPTVAVVGASTKPDRASNQCVRKYLDAGWTVWPVHPAGHTVHGVPAFRSLAELPGRPLIVTMYMRPEAGVELLDAIVDADPEWLWLNPGADGEPMASAAHARGLKVVEACNLVALTLGDPRDTARKVTS